MNRDVELSMEQAHTKWLVKVWASVATFVLFGLFGSAYSCQRIDKAAEVQVAHDNAIKAQGEANKAMWDHQK